jgi:FKBP-type peptidyl-prolyl cis-trans isomerase FklB
MESAASDWRPAGNGELRQVDNSIETGAVYPEYGRAMKATKMNKRLMTICAMGLLAGLVRGAEDKAAFKDPKEKSSYSIGANWGNNLKRQEVEVDLEAVIKGLRDGLAGKSVLTDQEVREALNAMNQEIRAKTEEKRKRLGETNKLEGEKFLAENKSKPGVVTLPSGLQYKVMVEGSGESPKSNDVVTANYRGTLIDGTEFDSSAKSGQPLVRPANMLIKGWTEALQLMKPGAKWQLFIPPDLAYGDRGAGAQIGPNATLIFEMELVSFKPPVAAPAQPVTSDIIKVPSKEELDKGAKVQILKPEDVEREQKLEAEKRKKQEEAEKKK